MFNYKIRSHFHKLLLILILFETFCMNKATNEIFALFDFELEQIYYKDEEQKVCFSETFDYVDLENRVLIYPQQLPSTIAPEDVKNLSFLIKQFCGEFPVYSLSKRRNKRSTQNGEWYPGGASQSQIQGQVSGQGFFSGQAQSQISGASQTQVQLSGNGILGSVSSSAGNAQAQIALGEKTGSGQAGSLEMGPSKSQSMASAGVLADSSHTRSQSRYSPGIDVTQNQYGVRNNGHRFGRGDERDYQNFRYPGHTDTASLYRATLNPTGHQSLYSTSNEGTVNNQHANLPQLPDVINGFPSFHQFPSSTSQGIYPSRNGYSNNGISTQLDHRPRSTTTTSNQYEYPSTSGAAPQQQQPQYGASSTGSNYPNTAYSLPSTSGAGQTQTQSQMVYLGRGSTEFYRPQFTYPQTSGNGNGESSRGHQQSTYTGTLQRHNVGQSSRNTNNGIFQSTQTQPQSYNRTRDTIKDGYIPTGNGYVRPYLNGAPRLHTGINNGVQYSTTTTPSSIVTQYPNYYSTTFPPTLVSSQHRQPTREGGIQQQFYYPNSYGRGENGYNYNPTPTAGQTQDPGFYTSYNNRRSDYSNGNGGFNGNNNKRCAVITFTCTILIESNGRGKICRPSQASTANSGNGGSLMQVCCC